MLLGTIHHGSYYFLYQKADMVDAFASTTSTHDVQYREHEESQGSAFFILDLYPLPSSRQVYDESKRRDVMIPNVIPGPNLSMFLMV